MKKRGCFPENSAFYVLCVSVNNFTANHCKKVFPFQFPAMERCILTFRKKNVPVDSPFGIRVKDNEVRRFANGKITIREAKQFCRVDAHFLYNLIDREYAIMHQLQRQCQGGLKTVNP